MDDQEEKRHIRRIWKYNIDPVETLLKVPFGTMLLSCGMQRDQICLWASVPNPNARMVTLRVIVRGTGWEFEPYVGEDFLGTVMQGENADLIWHVFWHSVGTARQERMKPTPQEKPEP